MDRAIQRFVVDSFQRHLDRLLTLEEQGGYVDLLLARNTCPSEPQAALQAEQEVFRTEARQIAEKLKALPAILSLLALPGNPIRFVTFASSLGKNCSGLNPPGWRYFPFLALVFRRGIRLFP